MKAQLVFSLLILLGSGIISATEHTISVGVAPQTVMDQASPGDRIVFLPGIHEHELGKHRSLLYIDKPIEIEFREGAVLKLASHVCEFEVLGEITTDQDAEKKLDDLSIGGQFSRSEVVREGRELYGATIYSIVIDSVGQGSVPDTFAWGDQQLMDTPHKKVAITGHWQELSQGVQIRFAPQTGHSLRSVWYVSYDGPEAYGIQNYMETAMTAIEPNFNLEGYEVIGNVIKTGGVPIHCWRKSKQGLIADNLLIDDNTGKAVVKVNAPRGWENPEPPVLRNNRNHLSDKSSR